MSQRGRPALLPAVSTTRRKPAASNVEVNPTYDSVTSSRWPSASIG